MTLYDLGTFRTKLFNCNLLFFYKNFCKLQILSNILPLNEPINLGKIHFLRNYAVFFIDVIKDNNT